MYVAGFDGGGSNARLAIATRQGEIVFRQDAGGINALDNPEWRQEYEKLFDAAGGYLSNLTAACFGISGWGEVKSCDEAVLSWLCAHLPCKIQVMNDVELAHHAAFGEAAGILLLSGTGSMALGRTKGGDFIKAGGFGHLIGDEGSAYWIGQQALMRLAREIDGRAFKSSFGEALAHYLGITFSLNGVMDWLSASRHVRSHIAALSQAVDSLAEAGHLVAQELLVAAARELFLGYQAVSHRLSEKGEKHAWATAGSTCQSNIIQRTLRDLIGYDKITSNHSALDKAVRLALDGG